VHVQSGATRVDDVHSQPPCRGDIGVRPTSSKSEVRARGRKSPWRQYGVLVEPRVQLIDGFVTPSTNRPLCRTPQRNSTPVSCVAGRAQRGGTTDCAACA
jgi:hypothetical protein